MNLYRLALGAAKTGRAERFHLSICVGVLLLEARLMLREGEH
jgi:hypothetical protein